jgi:formyl-CoA transferase
MLAGGLAEGSIRWPGPEVGAHNREVYGGLLGLPETEIKALVAEGVI